MFCKKKICYVVTAVVSAFIYFCLPTTTNASGKVVNLYVWSGYLPAKVIQQFERETGVKVNISTYENNEVMYAKLKASNNNVGYDFILPTSNVIDRLRKEGMLEPLDKSLLPNWEHLNPELLHKPFDPESRYSIPFTWGTAGIFFNKHEYSGRGIHGWEDLWSDRFENQLLVLDDVRDVFAMALFTLGYSVNDTNPEHIKQAYEKLKKLMPNVKVFSTDMANSIIIDEDAYAGAAWSGDVYKAMQENDAVRYVYPKEGFVIWMDNMAIPKGAPHKKEVHAFINFLLRPEIAEKISQFTGYPTPNLTAQKRLPEKLRNDPTVYPDKTTLKRGQYEVDIGDETLELYETYWEQLKMGSNSSN